jgi:hypothetical protein
MIRAALLAGALLVAGCDAGEEPAPAPNETQATPAPAALPQVAGFPALASKDCGEVVEFYLESLGGREWARAALVWNDPAIDAARLEALFGGYRELQLEWPDPFVEGAAGSLYCTVSGKLTDARDPAKPLAEGTLLLQRVNDVPGATPDQLRWTLRSSTFVEQLDRSGGGEP